MLPPASFRAAWSGSRDHAAIAVALSAFALASLPALSLAWRLLDGALIANPYGTIVRESGLWSLRLLVIGFAITPLAALGGLDWLKRLRRMTGLFAAFYAALHVAAWGKDYGFDFGFLWDEIAVRFYLTVGFVASVALLVLAATSGRTAKSWLGPPVWRRVHGLIHVALWGGLLHYVLSRRVGFVELITYGAALAWLVGWRIARRRR
jgi:sulfoxide reductase heme-binding subunit YedZ